MHWRRIGVEIGFNWHASVGISGDWIPQPVFGSFAYGRGYETIPPSS